MLGEPDPHDVRAEVARKLRQKVFRRVLGDGAILPARLMEDDKINFRSELVRLYRVYKLESDTDLDVAFAWWELEAYVRKELWPQVLPDDIFKLGHAAEEATRKLDPALLDDTWKQIRTDLLQNKPARGWEASQAEGSRKRPAVEEPEASDPAVPGSLASDVSTHAELPRKRRATFEQAHTVNVANEVEAPEHRNLPGPEEGNPAAVLYSEEMIATQEAFLRKHGDSLELAQLLQAFTKELASKREALAVTKSHLGESEQTLNWLHARLAKHKTVAHALLTTAPEVDSRGGVLEARSRHLRQQAIAESGRTVNADRSEQLEEGAEADERPVV